MRAFLKPAVILTLLMVFLAACSTGSGTPAPSSGSNPPADSGGSAASSNPAAPGGGGAPGKPKIVVIGKIDANVEPSAQRTELAAQRIREAGSYQVAVNESLKGADLVFFVIDGPDGPMPDLYRQIEARAGEAFPRGAIMLSGDDLLFDADMQKLVHDEFRGILRDRYLKGGEADSWPMVLPMTDANLADTIKQLLSQPAGNYRIQK